MHHKFVVIDFDKPTARVYMGSYNFSTPADTKNGENLLLIRDRRIAVVLHGRGAAHLRPLPLPRSTQQRADSDRKPLQLAQAAAQAGREAVVGRRLHGPRTRSATASCSPRSDAVVSLTAGPRPWRAVAPAPPR